MQHQQGLSPYSFGATAFQGPSPAFWSGHQNGTFENPWLVHVDMEYPERHMIFDIEWVLMMRKNNYDRNGFNIGLSVSPMDDEQWSAQVPSSLSLSGTASAKTHPFVPAEFLDRVVLVKGPSIPYEKRCAERRFGPTLSCSQTKDASMTTLERIKEDDAGKWQWHAIIFPSGHKS